MKQLIFSLSLLFVTFFYLKAQKPPIDASAYAKWPKAEKPIFSPNGECYFVKQPGTLTYEINGINSNWTYKINNCLEASFSGDSKMVFYRDTASDLYVIPVSKSLPKHLDQAASFKISPGEKSHFVAWTTNNKQLVLKNLNTSQTVSFTNVTEYIFSPYGTDLILKRQSADSTGKAEILEWVSLDKLSNTKIAEANRISNITIDRSGCKMTFLGKDILKNNAIYFFKKGDISAKRLIQDGEKYLSDSLLIHESTLRFSNNGEKIFFKIKKNRLKESPPNDLVASIYDYRASEPATIIPPLPKTEPVIYDALVHTNKAEFIRLTYNNERLQTNFYKSTNDKEDFVLVWHRKGDWREIHWQQGGRPTLYLVSTLTGKRAPIIRESLYEGDEQYANLSPENRYVISFNRKKGHYFSYNILTGETVIISNDVPYSLYDESFDQPAPPLPYGGGIAGWLPNDKGIIVYDKYDLWQLDPSAKEKPINLTKKYGRRKQVVLRISNNFGTSIPVIDPDNELLLVGFNPLNKYNGFYKIEVNAGREPDSLTMGPYIYHLPSSLTQYSRNQINYPPEKLNKTSAYLVRAMSATDAPNYFYCLNFNKFTQLTFVRPHKPYNWLSADLIKYKGLDGSLLHGILYRPENFDSSKKYPVIFCIYERMSEGLNVFLNIAKDESSIQNKIPEYVSNGYCVFLPDIYYKIGEPGESAYNSVLGAIEYLIGKHWIDSTKLGLFGHSFGGYETNYIITKTNKFIAAVSAAGPTNLISLYGTGDYNSTHAETRQGRIGKTLWEHPELYIKNSPILYVNRVKTVLLLQTGKQDEVVPFSQGIEFFNALRRLEKPSWLLQYDAHGHSLYGTAGEDYQNKMRDFFDHYLMEKQAPEWMTIGGSKKEILTEPANLVPKIGDSKMRLVCSKDCQVCKKWQENMEY